MLRNMRFVICALVLAVASPAWAQVTFDAANDATASSVSLTIGAGTNKALLVCVNQNGNNTTVTDATWNTSEAMTLVGTASGGTASTNRKVTFFVLANPTSTTASAAATGGTVQTIAAASFFGVDQSTPVGTHATDAATTGTSSTLNVASAVNDLVADCISLRTDDGITVGANQTVRWTETPTSLIAQHGSTEPGAASTTEMSWTWDTSDNWAHIGVALKAATEPECRGRLALLGVGC